MPPRYTYWTIIIDGQPTAFRAAKREELLPTFHQLKRKNPDAELKWFARGKVWESPDEARRASARRDSRVHRRGGAPAKGERPRDKSWRPGGEHRDPREKFKKETWQARKRREKKAADPARAGLGATRREESRPHRMEKRQDRRDKRENKGRGDWRNARKAGKGRPAMPKGEARRDQLDPVKRIEPAPLEVPPSPDRPPVVPEPERPRGPDRPPAPDEHPRPDAPSPERIAIVPRPPERARDDNQQGAGGVAPPHKTKLPRLRKNDRSSS